MNKIKSLFLFYIIIFFSCDKDTEKAMEQEICYSGKLVKKGICMNYVIQVLSDNVDGNLIEKSWTNEFTEISYKNVFGLGSICDFPEDIDEGDQFSFLIFIYL